MIAIDSLLYFLAVPACVGSLLALAWEAWKK
jgi:hypothetical protein